MGDNQTFEVINQVTKEVCVFGIAGEVIAYLDKAPKERLNLNNLDNLYVLVLIDDGLDKEIYFPQEFKREHREKGETHD